MIPISQRLVRFARKPLPDKWTAIKATVSAAATPRSATNRKQAAALNKLSIDGVIGRFPASRPASFVLVSSDHGTLIINRNDYSESEEWGTYGVGYAILNSSSFAAEEISLALLLLTKRKETHGPGVFAIDCGANIGAHTVEWARHMWSWGTVIAIEAQERIFYCLCGNLAINNCGNARAIWAAVAAEAGEMHVAVPDYEKPSSFGSFELRKRTPTHEITHYKNSESIVKVITIDKLNLPRLDLLKIDVEGMEMEVLAGAEQAIKIHRPPMIIEVIKSNFEEIQMWLRNCGYQCFPFHGNVLALHEADPICRSVAISGGVLRIGAD